MRIAIFGLSITSSWGNGHAVNYRGLVRALAARGHRVLFLERDVPWYAENRDLPSPPFCETALYKRIKDLSPRHVQAVREADLVIVGSYVPRGVQVGRFVLDTASGVRAFYDIDTPVTLAALARGECAYLEPSLIPAYDLYLSFTGGPTLTRLEKEFGSPMARPLYCSVDPRNYYPVRRAPQWDLGYLGTYCPTRQPVLSRLMLEPAQSLSDKHFVVAGPQYPANIAWPGNVARVEHLPPPEHPGFYAAQRFTLNLTRADMVAAGWSPSIRLFEAGACGTPVISDWWAGLDDFFRPDEEIIVAASSQDVADCMTHMSEPERGSLARAARARVLESHTADARARELVAYAEEAAGHGGEQRWSA
ncbi:CgeB family protein [Desulfocurvibacter africanus]|uniref:Spore protein YkvP/CgeB glycosyl transferase-like domain-containing protein n=1 Tax=Desulfocurvibacter africanus subsp. africanus str. Walvis Bay TaxID=690850 RepID=F3YZJ6_DESAF|nr:glycosyltransferase [Desulfocurvibacter africanus]EGJ49695.1 hypothetical protein Desaf_1356 [Desulfocurvibacter africanus subsp. africanus str. Walvis Bay]